MPTRIRMKSARPGCISGIKERWDGKEKRIVVAKKRSGILSLRTWLPDSWKIR
jgi:hypothetical protein